MGKLNHLLLFCIVMTCISSCGEKPYYESYTEVPKGGWQQDSIVAFKVDVTDTTVAFDVHLLLRANKDYPYSNLYIFREVESERGKELRDTVQYILADRFGKWLGEGTGDLKTYEWAYWPRAIKFKNKGTYTFTIQQAMRDAKLEGIESVGLSLYKKENNGKES